MGLSVTLKKQRFPLLIGVDQIAERCGLSEKQFYVWLSLGLPARKVNGRWYAHQSNIDDYFRAVLKKGLDIEVPDDL